jgi:hypothetical protein
MKRRSVLLFVVVVIALAGAGWIYVAHRNEQARQANRDLQKGIEAATKQLRAVAKNMGDTTLGPSLDWRVNLDGDVTTITITATNRSTGLFKDLVYDGFALGKVAPREKETLPIKIAELAPKASHQFVLHYDHVKWLGDDVGADRIDTGWAQQPLSYSNSWVLVADSSTLDPNGNATVSDSKGAGDHNGVPICLDEKTAHELKARRDSARAGASAAKDTHARPSSAKP